MKKILALIPLVCLALCALAQDTPWQWQPGGGGAQDRTVVFADLVVNGSVVPPSDVGSHYLIGAFIDGQCRGVAECVTDRFTWLQVEVYGNYGGVGDEGKAVSFRLYDKSSGTEHTLTASRPVTWTQESYGTPSHDHVVLSAWLNRDDAVVTYPARLTLSRLHDVPLRLTHANAGETVVDLSLLQVVISRGPNSWTVATASGYGLDWTLRGVAVGEYDYYVTYAGNPMPSDAGTTPGKLVIPAEVGFEDGWDWISTFMPTSCALVNPSTGSYLSTLDIDGNNKVIEMRSQEQALYNDPVAGIFGDLTELSCSGGAYKIKSTFEEKNRYAKVFNFGTSTGKDAWSVLHTGLRPGYNWIAYPHEQPHTLAVLQYLLSSGATEGDVIIGRDAFIEFDGYEWRGTLTSFEPGKGYIYYSAAAGPSTLNWGSYYRAQEAIERPHAQQAWHYDARQHASSMPVVAVVDGVADAGRYSVGAFVGEECRGHGTAADGLHFFITVSGSAGEEVRFRLHDSVSGTYSDLPGTLRYGPSAGSLRAPVALGATQGISSPGGGCMSLSYSGGRITVNGAPMPVRLCVRDLSGKAVLTSASATASTASLPCGVYTVTASSGQSAKTIKITK